MSVTVNGKEILLTLASESNTLTWMPGGDEAVNLRELSGNGWTYFEDIGPLSFHRYEALISPNVDGGKELFRFTFGRHLDKGDTFVSQTIEAKPSI
ncbi:MAG: hypothetical protein NT149_03500 [Candidatus Gottesmanbacteria bacterium]|nr:hypothetical protein [Candidatus Gottesmanbacteria bacterium]